MAMGRRQMMTEMRKWEFELGGNSDQYMEKIPFMFGVRNIP
jgi:hypothetical protein